MDNTDIDDQDWERRGKIAYRTIEGDRLEMTYNSNGGIGTGKINGKERLLKNWDVLDSPYLKQELYSGFLELMYPGNIWCLSLTLTGTNGCNQK